MRVVLVTIGDELLNGQTVNTNAAWLGRQLNDIGIEVVESIVVSDKEDQIVQCLERVSKKADLIVTTGGLGPTYDDVTKKAIAHFLNRQLDFNEVMYDRLDAYFRQMGRPLTTLHKNQCFLPSGCVLLDNSQGTAPGMWMKEGELFLLSLPGVPYEMKSIMLEGGLKMIRKHKKERTSVVHYIIQTTGLGEGQIALSLADIISQLPDYASLAYLPGIASVKLRLTFRTTDEAAARDESVFWGRQIEKELGDIVYANGDISLSQAIGELCVRRMINIGTAESCTGGYIAHLITETAGSSRYFQGAVVSYSNDVKTSILGVRHETLAAYGAVSEQTVCEMVKGLVTALPIDVGIAVSGIAGPGGGTPDKPVGTVWVAVGNNEKVETKCLQLAKNRTLNIKYATVKALDQLRHFIITHYPE